MSAQIGDSEENPENDGGDEHGNQGGEADLVKNSAHDVESTANEAEKEVFHGEVEEHGDAGEHGGEIPFSLFKEGLNALHEKAHESEEKDGVAKLHVLDLAVVNAGVAAEGVQDLLGIPEEATEKDEKQHSSCRHGSRTAGYDEREDQNTGVIPRIDRREKLLNDTAQEKEANEANVVEKHFLS